MQWPKEKDRQCSGQMKKTDNAVAKRKRQTMKWPKEKDRQYNGQKKKTDNAVAKRKRTKRQTIVYNALHEKQQIEKH